MGGLSGDDSCAAIGPSMFIPVPVVVLVRCLARVGSASPCGPLFLGLLLPLFCPFLFGLPCESGVGVNVVLWGDMATGLVLPSSCVVAE